MSDATPAPATAADKRALLAEKLKRRKAEGKRVPLSFAQERLWVLDRLEGEAATYNMPAVLDLRGDLDTAALAAALTEITRRHEVLRGRFKSVDGEARHVILPPSDVAVPVTDAADEAEAEALARAEAAAPFDLDRDPPLRARLLRLAADRHWLMVTLHHIAGDGWSTGVLVHELSALYTAFREGRESPLPPLALQYADAARWQREWLSGETLAGEVDWWRKTLDGAPSLTALPTDHPRPAVQSFKGSALPLAIPAEVRAGVEALAKAEGATPFMVLLAAWAAVLARYGAAEEVCVGTPVAGRPRAELEPLIGCFVNTLVLRCPGGAAADFRAHLKAVKALALDAFAHQDLPFEKLVDALDLERTLSHSPLFQVMFVLQNTPRKALDLPGLTLEPRAFDTGTAKFDLTLALAEDPDTGGYAGSLEYATDLFTAETAARLAFHVVTLLTAAVAAPDTPVARLPLMPDAERALVVEGWNQTAAPWPRDKTLADLLAEAAARVPRAEAVVSDHGTLTYDALHRRAAQLAHRLRALGVAEETRVGVSLPRTPDLIVALLAIHMAGGAYVPLDPAYPAGRVALMLEDSAAPVVVTTSAVAAGLLKDSPSTLLRLDSEDLSALPDTPPPELARPEGLAYVLYTSGSTGRPKGVAIEHRAAVCFVAWALETFGREKLSAVLGATSICFDLSVFEIFATLAAGGTLYLADDALHLQTLKARDRVRLVNTVPSAVAALLADGGGLPASVEVVNLAGEPLPRSLATALYESGVAEVYDLYGPSEDTTYSTFEMVPREGPVTIGRPLANTRAYVLDALGQPVPVGVPGELYLASDSLARGYHGREDLTAERFLPCPFGAGGRMYRTGDLVRWRGDGRLDYLGRLDHQVKVRGFRIELGEIEEALRAHADVAETVVTAPETASGGRRLVAYVAGPAVPDAAALRAHLARTLPDHMIPGVFVTLPRLPQTPNGKVDRKALPEPDAEAPAQGAGHVAPRTEAEQALAAIWAEVLDRPAVGVTDNFFELGGDSIVSLRIVAKARTAGLTLTPRQVFQHQTIAELAAAASTNAAPEATRAAAAGTVPGTPIQRWLLDRPGPLGHFNQSVLLSLPPKTDPAHLGRLLARLVEHHEALRLGFRKTAEGWAQTHHPAPATVDVRVAETDDIPAEAARAKVFENLDAPPLLRAVWFPRSGRLLLTIHHLVVDAVSWRVLLEDFATLLTGGTLPPRTASFQAWATALTAVDASAELPYWTQALEAVAPLPLEGPAEGPTVVTEAALEDALPPAVRVPDLLLAALGRVLGRRLSRTAVTVAVEGHGRDAAPAEALDVSRTVGWFTSLYPLRLPADPAAAPVDALKAVAQAARTVPGAGAGFGLLRERVTGREPDVLVNYLGRLDGALPPGAPFALADEDHGPDRASAMHRPHALELDAAVADGALRLRFTHQPSALSVATVEALAAEVVAELRALAEAATGADLTIPADLPLAGLDQLMLDALTARFGPLADAWPLTPMQAGMAYETALAETGGVYVQQSVLTLSNLDPAAFRRAWEALVDRHPILRGAVVTDGVPRPLMVVPRGAALPWREEDWRTRSAAEQARALDQLQAADRAAGFDLARPPLIRCVLARLADDRWAFLVSRHHVILDGWSLPILLAEVGADYAALRAGRPTAPAPATSFRDHAARLAARDPAADETFWRDALTGLPSPTPLPWAEPAGGRGAGESVLRLSPASSAALAALARWLRVTPSVLVQGAWALLLARHAGTDEAVYGLTVSGRPADLPGVDRMVGLFINTLPLRVAVDEDTTLAAWLTALRDAAQAAEEHGQVALADLQAWAGHPGRALFESAVVFENYPDATAADTDDGLRVESATTAEETSLPLTLAVVPGEAMALHLSWRRDRFDAATADRLLAQMDTLLTAFAAADGSEPLAALPLMPDVECSALDTWAKGAEAPVPAATVLEMIGRWTADTPDAPAVRWWDGGALSFAELDARARSLAAVLRARGVGRETRVGLLLDRCPEMPAALLAVLMAGGAYVPLDPAYPADRLAYMVADSGAALVLTREGLADKVPEGAEALSVDTALDPAPNAALPAVAAEDLAYVIYTSGSTGRPKGVAVPHGGLAHYLDWAVAYYRIAEGNGAPLSSSLSFDATITALLGPLAAGRPVTLVPPGDEIEGLAALLADRPRFSLLKITPAHLDVLTRLLPRDRLADAANVLVIGGEALTAATCAPWLGAAPAVRLVNEYGPTETVVGCCIHEARAEDGPAIPIGRPIARTTLRVLDARLRPVPIGAAGELFIGGSGVARGYLGRADLTAERFIADPHGPAGARLYRTGDLCRMRPDGVLEYLGRTDHQVKVRGFRIELGEIEAALRALPGVADAACLAQDDPAGDGKRLVAWVTGGADPLALRQGLAKVLPAHMIPAVFVPMEALPLTTNGKVDRSALPAPEAPASAASEAPADETEATLAGLWAEVLGVPAVGRSDGFHALGGHSLKAVQLASRIRAAFGVAMPLKELLARATVAEQAAWLKAAAPASADAGLPAAPPAEHYPLSHAQRRLWLVGEMEGPSARYTMPGAYLFAPGTDTTRLRLALKALFERHAALRTRFIRADGEPRQIVEPDAPPIPEAIPATEDEARAQAARMAAEPFDLARDRLTRVRLFALPDGRVLLAFMLHHILGDGWSMQVLHEDLEALYAGRPLPPLARAYTDYAVWESAHGYAADERWWLERLGTAPGLVRLPFDFPETDDSAIAGGVESVLLPPEASALLRKAAADRGMTVSTVVLGVFLVFLNRLTEQEDLAVAMSVANRPLPELEPMVGFFVNAMVLRMTVDPDGDFNTLLSALDAEVTAALDHQSYPFDMLVERLNPPRRGGRQPLFNVNYAYQAFADMRIRDDGTAPAASAMTGELALEATTAKFDLTLFVVDTAGPAGDQLQLSFEYAADLFRRDTIAGWLGGLGGFCEAVAQGLNEDAAREAEPAQ
ncbi:non-ribosomal peptide synthetase [Caenispirillum salinarum]|uniref:non-ribosomal peptide synthetase n=1 Tax=Caenispirillum salinarum TaxID=859058 RepID=UPI0002F605BA|nr:non-ribosomal peptide synthetase [Caenispirillum salinarum]